MAHILRRCVSLRLLASTIDGGRNDVVRSQSLLMPQCQSSLSWSQRVCLRRRYSVETVTGSVLEESRSSNESVGGDEKGLKLSDSCVKVCGDSKFCLF